MPYLMLSFAAEREVMQEDIGFGQLRTKPTGREEIELTMIDTEKGQVVEIKADAMNVKQKERKPTPGEMMTASQTLKKGVGEQISKVEYDRLKEELNSYRQKSVSAEKTVRDLRSNIDMLQGEVADTRQKLKKSAKQKFKGDEETLVAAALDNYIEYLVNSGQYKSYEDAKKLYKKMTGRPWVDEGMPDDDDEEGDPPGNLIENKSFGQWTDFSEKKSDPAADIALFVEQLLKATESQEKLNEQMRKPYEWKLEIGGELKDLDMDFGYREMMFISPRRGGKSMLGLEFIRAEQKRNRERQHEIYEKFLKFYFPQEETPPPKKRVRPQDKHQMPQKNQRAPKKISPRKSR